MDAHLSAQLPDHQQALWFRLQAHDFEPPAPQNFTRRLMRERRWPLNFTRGAIAEYRKFCFLAVTAPHPVTPSVEIDHVWHLHLIYSRDYWDVWCGQILRAPLHHDPTAGGPAQSRKYHAQYAQTLLAYEQVFGPPPASYWPATHRRFAPATIWSRLPWR
jgi:hypothetical protein